MINVMLLTAAMVATQDAHIPSVTVNGDVATFDADVVILPAVVEKFELLQGTSLIQSGGAVAASTDGVSPVIYRFPAGSYRIPVYGFPDDRENPQRLSKTLEFTIAGPTRQQAIAGAIQRLTLALFDAGQAKAELDALSPTRDEIATALLQSPNN